MKNLDNSTPITELRGPHTIDIDSSRNVSEDIKKGVSKHVNQLLQKDTLEIMIEECNRFFPGKENEVLREFFVHHPNRWSDIGRIIHTHVIKHVSSERYEMPEKYHDEIYMLFIINGPLENHGKKLHDLVEKSILKNQAFLRSCSKQKSLLDSSSHILSLLDEGNLEQTIKNLILKGMISNIEGCTYTNNQEFLGRTLKKIIKYLPDVFAKYSSPYDSLEGVSDISDLASRLHRCIINNSASSYGKRRQDVMRIIQAFHAWGNISQIEKSHENAMIYATPENMRKILKSRKIELGDGVNKEFDSNGNILYKGSLLIKGKSYKFIWRAKSMKSILTKLWETEEYTNINAMRDMLGGTILFNNETEDEKIEVMCALRKIFPDYGYISKNKGLLAENEMKHLSVRNIGKHHAMYTTNKRGSTTDKNLINASDAGFIHLEGYEPCGFEMQYMHEEGYEWKKKDDLRYKIDGKLILLLRGENMITPNDLYRSMMHNTNSAIFKAINELGKIETRKKIHDEKDLILYLIENNKIIPYVRDNAVIFTIPTYKDAFMNEYEGWEELDIIKNKQSLRQFITKFYIEPSDS